MKVMWTLLCILAVTIVAGAENENFAEAPADLQNEQNNSTETDMFSRGCGVVIDIGNGWSNETSGELFVVYLQISSDGGAVSKPWTLSVESPFYSEIDGHWNFILNEFHEGYIEGTVNVLWHGDAVGQAQIVDVGFIIYNNGTHPISETADDDWRVPQFISANGHQCHVDKIYRIEGK